MTVRLLDSATIVLEGDCPVEDAAVLLERLLAAPNAIVDWRRCSKAHLAVIQVLMTAKVTMHGPPGDGFLAFWVQPLLSRG
ncbi:MAG TPA: hypothetical protein VGM72_03995 [Micropepsaceae bacterium]|jgi:hypothetical protein